MSQSAFRRASHLAWRRIGDEFVVVNLAAKEMIGLDATGGALFERLEHPHSAAALALCFAGDDGDRASTIAAFCQELTEIGVLVAGEATPGASGHPAPLPWSEPNVLWREPLTAVVNQASPPPALGNPQCGY